MIIAGLIGYGFVGKATRLLENPECAFVVYDVDEKKRFPTDVTIKEMKNKCDLIFVCVPTPMNVQNGSCSTMIVENVLNELRGYKGGIIIRSTVPVGFCENHSVYFMPEFLTERNAEQDFINSPQWILGGPRNEKITSDFSFLIQKAFEYQKIRSNLIIWMDSKEAECVKYFRNNFLALKVSFCNEIYDFCQKLDINYAIISQIACSDERIGTSHIQVPGIDGHRGFGGTCLPKDNASLIHQFNQYQVECPILKSIQSRNDELDRPEQDWKTDYGRSII